MVNLTWFRKHLENKRWKKTTSRSDIQTEFVVNMTEITKIYVKQVWIGYYDVWVSSPIQNDQNQTIYGRIGYYGEQNVIKWSFISTDFILLGEWLTI